MIIIKFRGKYIILDAFDIGVVTYLATLGVILLLKWRKKTPKGSASRFLNRSILKVRGGDYLLRRFLKKKLKKGRLVEITDPAVIRKICVLLNYADSTGLTYIDTEVFAYALKTKNRVKISELVTHGFFTCFETVKVVISVIIAAVVAKTIALFASIPIILSTIVLIALIYCTTPFQYYSGSVLTELPVNQDNISYVLKGPKEQKFVTSLDKISPELKVYQKDGKIIASKEEEKNGDSIVLEHRAPKKKKDRERMHNRKTWTFRDIGDKVTANEASEINEDVTYVREKSEREEARRIRIQNDIPKPDSK